MAWGVNSVMSMGVGALFASQANIQTTGNNISNVNTPGYSRQAVILQEKYAINSAPGQVGQGVQATEVIRYFDAFVEKNYLDKLGTASRYQSQYSQLRYVDNLFNESNVSGISSALSGMFESWNKLSQQPESLPSREALLASANTLTTAVRNTDAAMRDLENQINESIRQDVASANQLMREIAALNREIAANYLAGRNNPNSLMDARDTKVRDLATILDVDVHDRGPGDYSVTMKNGNLLVQGDIAYSLDVMGARAENHLTPNSPYKTSGGTVHFAGKDNYEYTIEMVSPGTVGGDPAATPPEDPPRFKVSIDGGKSWLTDDNGQVLEFNAQEEGSSVRAGELDLWFDAGQVAEGDRFVIAPKTDVYWVSPTAGPINISTQIYADGTDNSSRLTGGTLAGLLEFRDYRLGEYRDRLDAFAKTVAWEVNRVHSQGAGLTPWSSMFGTYAVGKTDEPMSSPEARFTWADKLQSGNMTFSVYDAETGQIQSEYPGLEVFSDINFNPETDSLEDVVAALNAAMLPDGTQPFQAEIVDGRVKLSSNPPGQYTFAVMGDTTGLAAALGLNTFFTGDTAATFGVHPDLSTNLNLINSGRLNGAGQVNPGDNQTALEIQALNAKAVDISTVWNKSTSQSLNNYYATLVTKVGSDTQNIRFTAATETSIAQDLYDRQEEISGVNLDEEMSNLIKFQASYKAAAKLITTADEMLQTLLSLKQ